MTTNTLPATTPSTPIKQKMLHTAGAVLHLGMRSAQELTDLVAEMHSTITDAPMPNNQKHRANAQRAPFPYRIVAGSFALLARLARLITAQQTEFSQYGALSSQAALNGVCGDKLEAWASPFALPLTLRDAQGNLLDSSTWAETSATGHVVFLHGLCFHDQAWHQFANHRDFAQQLTTAGYQVAWLRYNTGRAIHQNGADLSDLLQRHFSQTGTPLWLIGHSMGGLLIRSASHQAANQQHSWLDRLTHAVYIGTPHLGAPWEVAGNKLNNLLGITPYTRPLMRLGNIRSLGIRDLRVAHITADQIMPQLHPATQHLMLAAAWSELTTDTFVGDGIVPVSSALAQDVSGDVLSAPKLKRVLLKDINHLTLLDDARVYGELKAWLAL